MVLQDEATRTTPYPRGTGYSVMLVEERNGGLLGLEISQFGLFGGWNNFWRTFSLGLIKAYLHQSSHFYLKKLYYFHLQR